MRAYDIILKKRRGQELAAEEIGFMVNGFVSGEIPDYQMAAWCMAVFFQGMNDSETAALTMAMADSGDRVDFGAIEGIKVDKHSTGGVGDVTTLVVAPLVAAAGVRIAKMAGRGLGHTGGTIDKLESIPGFRTGLSVSEFIENVRTIGIAIASPAGNFVPADKKLYALRDVTATVDSLPLIASSIMSKKIAGGADALVLDVKVGSGAFMKTPDEAWRLAKIMTNIGNQVGLKTVALITDMTQPLGRAVGNALEVREAVETLRGNGPEDLEELCLAIGTEVLMLAGVATTENVGREILKGLLRNGQGIAKLKELVMAQGGDPTVIDAPELLPAAEVTLPVRSPRMGYVHGIDAEAVGMIAMRLGAGRARKEDAIDPGVGIEIRKKVGDYVEEGETLGLIHAKGLPDARIAARQLVCAYNLGEEAVARPRLIYYLP